VRFSASAWARPGSEAEGGGIAEGEEGPEAKRVRREDNDAPPFGAGEQTEGAEDGPLSPEPFLRLEVDIGVMGSKWVPRNAYSLLLDLWVTPEKTVKRVQDEVRVNEQMSEMVWPQSGLARMYAHWPWGHPSSANLFCSHWSTALHILLHQRFPIS